jgi:hypothetical protein
MPVMNSEVWSNRVVWSDRVGNIAEWYATRILRISRGALFGGISVIPERGDTHPTFDSMRCVDRDVIDKRKRLVRLTYKATG